MTDLGRRLSWRRLGVLIRQLPPGAALYRSMHGEKSRWGDNEYLLALIADQLAVANWQRAGKKNSPRPKPVPRPGVEDDTKKRIGNRSFSVTELRKILGR